MGSAGLGGLLAATAVAALVCAGVGASARQATTHPVLQQTAADCSKIGAAPGVVVLGLACADERGLTDPGTWNVGASSAHWAEDTFGSAYEWDVPETIPAAGAPLTLKVATADLTRLPAASTCAHLEASGGFVFRTGTATVTQPVGVDACAPSGGSAAKNLTVTLVPPAGRPDTAVLRITVKNGPTLTYRYGTREGRFSFTAGRPALTATGDPSSARVTATVNSRRVTAQYEVLVEHARTSGKAKVATASLELVSIAPRSLARGCAPGATASLTLTDDGRHDAVRLTARGACSYLSGTFANGKGSSAKVTISR
jgi:hypothetical protein